jgi:hypothetical protein
MNPEPQERGWKDTVIAYPNQITRIISDYLNHSSMSRRVDIEQ